jgi:hypothetical protein
VIDEKLRYQIRSGTPSASSAPGKIIPKIAPRRQKSLRLMWSLPQ